MKYELVIFDWDGTLTDSTLKISKCLREAALSCGLPSLSLERYRSIIGLGLAEAIIALYPELDEAMVDEYSQAYSHIYVHVDETPQGFFEGAKEAVQLLRDSDRFVAVATGKSRRGLDRVLSFHDMEGVFHTTRCADETKSKPHPLMLEEILAELNIAPKSAVMIGDTSFDLEMAALAGVDRIGVSYGAHDVCVLEKFSPVTILNSLTDLHKWV